MRTRLSFPILFRVPLLLLGVASLSVPAQVAAQDCVDCKPWEGNDDYFECSPVNPDPAFLGGRCLLS